MRRETRQGVTGSADHRLRGRAENERDGRPAVVDSVKVRGRVATITGRSSTGRVIMVLAEITELDEVTILVASLGEGRRGGKESRT